MLQEYRLKRESILIYRPLSYCIIALVILLQSYVIWQDRINKISMVTYSYGTGTSRSMDTAFVEEIKYSKDYINACILIQDKTKRSNIMIHSWQNLYKDRETIVEWKTK